MWALNIDGIADKETSNRNMYLFISQNNVDQFVWSVRNRTFIGDSKLRIQIATIRKLCWDYHKIQINDKIQECTTHDK